MKHEINLDFDRLLAASDHKMLSKNLSHFYTRPAFYGTSLARDLNDAKRKNQSDIPGGNGNP